MIFYGGSYLICDMCNTKHPVTSNAEEQNLLLCYPDEKDKQEWQVTADKVYRGEVLERMDDYPWYLLRKLVDKYSLFLSREEEELKTKMLKILYGTEDEELDKEMKFTKDYISQKFIVAVCEGSNREIRDIILYRRHSLNNFIRETVVPSVIVLAGFLAMIGVLCFL